MLCMNPESGKNWATKDGMNINACAKMIGITPDALTLSGRNCLTPPYCLLPTIRLAYCTGIFRVPCTSRTVATMTASNKAISTMKKMAPPPVLEATLELNSASNANGKRAMIPMVMRIEIPFPMPLSVIFSPSHIQNIVPAVSTTTVDRVNKNWLLNTMAGPATEYKKVT